MSVYHLERSELIEYQCAVMRSGCLDFLQTPQIFERGDFVTIRYPDLSAGLPEIPAEEIRHQVESALQSCYDFLLTPENLILHPSTIVRRKSALIFQYLPSKTPPLYGKEDLYACLERSSEIREASARARLLFRRSGRVELLLLSSTTVGSSSRSNIIVDGCGEPCVIRRRGKTHELIRGGKAEKLTNGSIVSFGEEEAIFLESQ